MIIPIKNKELAKKIVPLIEKVDLPYDKKGYFQYIIDRLYHDDTVLFVDVDDEGKARSFAFIEVVISITDREAFIDLAYFDPHMNGTGKDMADLIIQWAKLKNCKRASALVKEKKDNAFIRKYGFDTRFIYVSKEIKEDICPAVSKQQ
jgi:GNAT superfamily N-acetyltransferase